MENIFQFETHSMGFGKYDSKNLGTKSINSFQSKNIYDRLNIED